MSVIKFTVNDRFTTLPNETVWDPDLSCEALGLLARIVSRPETWQIYASELSKSCKLSRDKVRHLLTELQDAGYLKVPPRTRNEKGAFTGLAYEAYTRKQPVEIQKSSPQPEKPSVVHNACEGINAAHIESQPQTENPGLDNQAIEKKDQNKERQKERERAQAPSPTKWDKRSRLCNVSQEERTALEASYGPDRVAIALQKMESYVASSGGRGWSSWAARAKEWIQEDMDNETPVSSGPLTRTSSLQATNLEMLSKARQMFPQVTSPSGDLVLHENYVSMNAHNGVALLHLDNPKFFPTLVSMLERKQLPTQEFYKMAMC